MITLLLLSINLACNKAATEPPLDTGEKTQANVDKTRSEAILTDVSQQQPETPINAILNLPEDQAGLVLAMEEKETAAALYAEFQKAQDEQLKAMEKRKERKGGCLIWG